MFFKPEDITNNVLSNPVLSYWLQPNFVLPIKLNNNEIKSISNTKAYRQNPVATIQLIHTLQKLKGNLFYLFNFK